MANAPSPINWDVAITDKEGRPTQEFMRWLTDQFQSNATAESAQQAADTAQAGVDTLNARKINTTAPLAGGGDLSADRTLTLNDSGVTAGTYGTKSKVARITVDTKGRITTATAVPVALDSFTVAGAPSASTAGAGAMIYVTDEVGGPVAAASDGTNWRRSTDRAIIA